MQHRPTQRGRRAAAAVIASSQPVSSVALRVCVWQGHREEVYGCEFLHAGSALHLATCSAESILLWDAATGTHLAEAGPPGELRGEAPGAQRRSLQRPQLLCDALAGCTPLWYARMRGALKQPWRVGLERGRARARRGLEALSLRQPDPVLLGRGAGGQV